MLGGVLGRDKHRIPLTDFYVRNTRRTRGSPRAALKQPLPISKGSGKVQVVFVSTEVSPWSKTGGLGDVMDALPVELATRGHRVMTVSPRYAQYNKVYDTGLLVPVEVPLLGQPPEPECGLSVDGIWEAPQPPQEEEDGHRDDDYSTDCRDLADAAAGHAPQPSESRSAHHHSHQSHTTGHLSEQVLVQQQELTEISYARYYAVEDRGVLRVFVDHPVFAAPLTDEGSRYEHGQEQRSGMLLDPAPRAGPIFTYGEGADNLELQARNSVLCQAALAAPVLLWGSPEALPRDLQQSAGFSTTPLALQNGLARACAADPNAPRTDSKAAAMQDYAASPLLFVSNDWPTALLPLWLKAYRDLLFTTQAANAFLAQAVNSALVPPSSLFSPVESDVDAPTITEPTNSSSSSSVALDAGSAIEAAACGTVNGATAPGPWSASIAAVGAQPGPLAEPLAEQNGGSSGEGLRSVLIAAKLKARALARSAAAVSEAAAAVAALGVPPFAQYWERQRTSPPIKRPATASTLASAPASVQSASPQHFCSARQQHGAADEHSCDTPLYPDPWQQHLHPQQVVELQQCTLPQQPQPHPPLLWSQSQPLSLSTGSSSSSSNTCSGTGTGAAVYVDGEAVRMPPSVPDGSGLFGAGPGPPSSGLGQYDSAQAAVLGSGTAWHQQQQQLVDAAEQRAGMQFMTDMHGVALGVEIDAQLHEAAFPHVPGVLQAGSAGRGRVTSSSRDEASSSRDEASSMQGASACVDGASLHGALPSTGLVMSEAGVAGAVRAAQTDAQALQALVLYEQRRQEQLLLQLFYAVQQLYPGIMGDGFDEAGLDANASEAAQYLPGQRVSKRSDERQRSAEPRVIRERMQRTLANFRRLVASRLEAAKVVFTMHNAAFQGLFSAASFARLGLPQALLPPMLLGGGGSHSSSNNDGDDDASSAAAAQGHSEGSASSSSENASGSWDGDEHGDLPEGLSSSELGWEASGQQQQQAAGRMSWLKAALLTSDALVTVSPTYARELAGRGRQVSSNEMQAQVSPGHSAVMGLPCEGIQELQGILRTRGLQAITNGLDTVAWDPATDPLLPPNLRYQAQSVASGKARAKAVLQVVLGLEQRADVPLIGFVGRLEEQKGADVLLAALPALLGKAAEGVVNPSLYASAGRLLAQAAGAEASTAVDAKGSAAGQSQPVPDGSMGDAAAGGAASATGQAATPPLPRPAKTLLAHANASHLQAAADASLAAAAAAGQLPALQLAMLGLGQAWLQDAVTALQGAYPGRAAGIASFSEELAHLMMAGCDYLIVPSRYEPCGLVAMAALRYGTVPIVAPTGGLLDIVRGNASSSGACTDAGSAAAPDNSRDSASGRRSHGEQVYGVVAPLGIILRTAIAPAGDAMHMRLSQQAVADAIGTACELFGSRHFEELRLRCMQQDVSWSAAAEQWEALLHAVAAQADQPDQRA